MAKRDVAVVAISVDAPAANQALTEKLGLGILVLSDQGGTGAIRPFGVFDEETEIAWPSIFVVSKDGTITKRWLADTYKERIATADVMRDL